MHRAGEWRQFTTFRFNAGSLRTITTSETNTNTMRPRIAILLTLATAAGLTPILTTAQMTASDKKLDIDCHTARIAFIAKDPVMKDLFNHALAYVMFPNVVKGGLMLEVSVGGQQFTYKAY
jgi:hypothetical protein